MCGELLELDKVFHSLMVFMHAKLFKFGFGFSFRVESTKIGSSSSMRVQSPRADRIVNAQECRFKTIYAVLLHWVMGKVEGASTQ